MGRARMLAGIGSRTLWPKAKSISGDAEQVRDTCTSMRTASLAGVRSSGEHRAFLFSNILTPIWSVNTSPTNGAPLRARSNASTRSATSTPGVIRRSHSQNIRSETVTGSKKKPSHASSPNKLLTRSSLFRSSQRTVDYDPEVEVSSLPQASLLTVWLTGQASPFGYKQIRPHSRPATALVEREMRLIQK